MRCPVCFHGPCMRMTRVHVARAMYIPLLKTLTVLLMYARTGAWKQPSMPPTHASLKHPNQNMTTCSHVHILQSMRFLLSRVCAAPYVRIHTYA